MKKFINSKYSEALILSSLSILSFIFTIILFSIKSNPEWGEKIIWHAGDLENFTQVIENFCTGFIIAFGVVAVSLIVSLMFTFIKNKKWVFYISSSLNIVLNFALLFIHIAIDFLSAGALACLILSLLFSIAQILYMTIRKISTKEAINSETPEFKKIEEIPALQPKTRFVLKLLLLILEVLTAALAFTIFFVPLYSFVVDPFSSYPGNNSIKLIQVLSVSYAEEGFSLTLYIAFLVMFIAFFANIMALIASLPYFIKSENVFVKKSKQSIYGSVIFLLVFFILGFVLTFYQNVISENYEIAKTLSYIPLLCSLPLLVGFSAIQGRMGYGGDGEKIGIINRKLKIEPLIYVILLTIITFVSLVLNIIEVKIDASILSYKYKDEFSITGYKLLSTYGELGSGLQILTFLLSVMLLVSGVLLVFSIVSYFTKYKDYGKVIKTAAISNTIFVMLFGLSGLYFKIAQAINMDNIASILNQFGYDMPEDIIYNVSSKTIYMFIASFVILIVMLIRGQLNPESALSTSSSTFTQKSNTNEKAFDETHKHTAEVYEVINFDSCPAFTELDFKKNTFDAELKNRKDNAFETLTLPNLVQFVVNYAKECRLHLSYSLEDIATFVAGLGASRLTILQGMSGTGKTSLPKIFAEAVMGNCEIVEVESSWRDKNELLGYYNEFSKCFTPKKFTQCLYKARLNESVPTFIVLDEMNLSRIEYYFSDFLSLMEHEEDKREIKLLNVNLFRTENGEKKSYQGLTDGHTIKIPANVWFIGTANRDESTFEISDKVYDRAQTINFIKRAPKIYSYGEPLKQRFTSYDMICELFERAKTGIAFDAESNIIIQKVEQLLLPFNISFGNRILRQMEDFVKIYCACFDHKEGVLKEAVEKILLSKIVCKLEYKIVENKEALATEFDKLGLLVCSAFIRRLNED